MIVDLHLHTTYSDGLLTPDEIVDLAVKRGLDGIAITDHDNILGIEPAIKRSKLYEDFFVIPGIEFSCVYMDEEVHLLGYFFNYKSSDIIDLIEFLKKSRIERGIKMIEKLKENGVKIELEDIEKYMKKGAIGRPHIGRILIEKKYVKSMQEAFELYLNKGRPGYVERYKLKVADVINMIHKENGIVVIAHPGLIKNKQIIYDCIEMGIDGIEAIHSKHTKKNMLNLIEMAQSSNLIITGGSDCHGKLIDGDYLIGKYYIDLNDVPEMKRRL